MAPTIDPQDSEYLDRLDPLRDPDEVGAIAVKLEGEAQVRTNAPRILVTDVVAVAQNQRVRLLPHNPLRTRVKLYVTGSTLWIGNEGVTPSNGWPMQTGGLVTILDLNTCGEVWAVADPSNAGTVSVFILTEQRDNR